MQISVQDLDTQMETQAGAHLDEGRKKISVGKIGHQACLKGSRDEYQSNLNSLFPDLSLKCLAFEMLLRQRLYLFDHREDWHPGWSQIPQ